MKAVVHDTYGQADVLEFRDIDRPEPRDGEVLVRVHASAVDAGVWHLMTGLPYLLRLGFGLRRPRTQVRGMDVAGTVEAVGAKVTGFRPGDEVFGTCTGAFAEYAVTRQGRLAPKPANLTFEQAAAIPISGFTALQGLRDSGKVQAGQRVLVIGAAGGVGTYTVQLAKAFGAHVTGVCSTTKTELVRSIGADEVIDYTREDFVGNRYDLIIDTAGGRSLSHLRRALTAKGTLVLVGGETGGRLLGGVDRVFRAAMLSPFIGHTLRGLISTTNRRADLEVLRAFAEDGKLTPIVDRTYGLTEVPDAIRYLQAGNARGKVVITV
jgi:NADPH:quinone reductase-like Zn-dependent oxidoreductase